MDLESAPERFEIAMNEMFDALSEANDYDETVESIEDEIDEIKSREYDPDNEDDESKSDWQKAIKEEIDEAQSEIDELRKMQRARQTAALRKIDALVKELAKLRAEVAKLAA